MGKRTWAITVTFPGYNPAVDSEVEKILGPCAASGYGFGERDMAWYFPSQKTRD